MMKDLAQKISRSSVSSMDDVSPKPAALQPQIKRKDDFSIIVTPKLESQDPTDLKQKI